MRRARASSIEKVEEGCVAVRGAADPRPLDVRAASRRQEPIDEPLHESARSLEAAADVPRTIKRMTAR